VIRILIAENHQIARMGIAAIVNTQSDMEVVAEATNGQQAVTLVGVHRPDTVLMDMRMPVMHGFEAAAAIRADFPEVRMIALSTFAGTEDIHRAFAAGALASLSKDVLNDELLTAIRAVQSGKKYLTDSVSTCLAAARTQLSNREQEVLNLIAQGLINKHIAHALGLSEYTVKNYVKNILGKLDAEDRTQAVTVAIQRGIIHVYD
jgi:two-component system NarL family response regulator